MMAYPYDDARIILALQIDHSRVAGYFAAHWGNQDFDRPEPYSSVVLAATEHDIGWWEWEMKPSTLNDKGFPLDYHDGSFKYLGQLRLDFYKNSVDRVLNRDPYAAHVDGDARRRADERRLWQICLSTGPHFRPAREGLRRSPGNVAAKAARRAAPIRTVQAALFRRADMDQLRIHGGLRSAGAVCLQSLSVEQQGAQARPEPIR